MAKLLRGGIANTEELRRQPPLAETADELCAVARLLGAPGSAVHLGQGANERTLKALSVAGTLARARVVHFATHGLLAAETEAVAYARSEPALILTPPDKASDEDDGLLTATEVTQLKLDADWVVLSACNTASAASDMAGAEALSGLARAFFYAGAPGPARLALGGRFGGYRRTYHTGVRRDEGRPQSGASRGVSPIDARSDHARWSPRPSSRLGALCCGG